MNKHEVSPLGRILMETARDLTMAHVAGKPLDRVVSEGAARIAAHYSKPRYCKCGAELFGAVFDECSTCYREIKGGFSEDES